MNHTNLNEEMTFFEISIIQISEIQLQIMTVRKIGRKKYDATVIKIKNKRNKNKKKYKQIYTLSKEHNTSKEKRFLTMQYVPILDKSLILQKNKK